MNVSVQPENPTKAIWAPAITSGSSVNGNRHVLPNLVTGPGNPPQHTCSLSKHLILRTLVEHRTYPEGSVWQQFPITPLDSPAPHSLTLPPVPLPNTHRSHRQLPPTKRKAKRERSLDHTGFARTSGNKTLLGKPCKYFLPTP